MDFSSFNAGGIDHSPAPWITKTTLVLENWELAEAGYDRMERFWRVWYGDRKAYAPSLTDLTLVLRPGIYNGVADLHGINLFVDFYKQNLEHACETQGLKIFLDNVSELHENTRYVFPNAPKLLIQVNVNGSGKQGR